jgi:uncharacterized glyoxalase superfamily protein PhnB
MEHVTRIGGVFFKADDTGGLGEWYSKNLGLVPSPDGSVVIGWRDRDFPERLGGTVWALFKRDTSYFDPSKSSLMINYRVGDIDAMLAQLTAAGAEQVGEVESFEYGKFGWVLDPEGNKIELWQPPEREPFESSVPARGSGGVKLLRTTPHLGVTSVESSIEFYRTHFGFEVLGSQGVPLYHARLQRDAVGITLVQVDDVQTLHDRLVAAGVTLADPLTDRPWGLRDVVIIDPDGHKIAIGQVI